ncbi:LysR family transcriptional regulator [Priestia aryabhattai]|nr:LysR family transcriptional regulator [Priestia aryabhattai]
MRELNQRRVRYFYEVLTQGSVRGAAESLNTAPSVITRQVKLLEDEIGSILFERQARGVKPTEAAHLLLDFWRGCQAQQQQLEERLGALKGLQEGDVRVVLSEGFVDVLIDEVLGDFCSAYPGIRMTLDVLPVSAVLEEVASGKAHLGIAYNPPAHADIKYIASAQQPLRLLIRSDHPLTNLREPIELVDLMQYPLAIMPLQFGIGQALQHIAHLENLVIAPALVTNSLIALRRFVINSDAVTFMGEFSALNDTRLGDLATLKLKHELFNNISARLLVKKDGILSLGAEEFIKWIKNRISIFRT